jgi:hypothetical protein
MRAATAAVVLLASGLFAATPVFEDVPSASACSCPDCDGIRDSDVIVGGRITRWELSDREPYPERIDALPLDVHLEIDQVFKGSAPRDLLLFDPSSLSAHQVNGERRWMGGSGGCQAFDSDPQGSYVVIGYDRDGPNSLYVSGPRVMFRGPEPTGERYSGLLDLLHERLGTPRPPSVGDSPPGDPAPPTNDWMFLSAIGAGTLLITLLLLLGGPKREPRDGSDESSGRADSLD